MEQFVNGMIGYAIRATDGDLGKVEDFLFDDKTWTIRYMVVETGNWLSGRKVLISLAALGRPDWKSRTFSVNLTREQVKNSPDIDTQKPVFRQHETTLHKHYQWPLYWQGGYVGGYVSAYGGILGDGGMGAYGGSPGSNLSPFIAKEESGARKSSSSDEEDKDNPHLLSTKHVTGYRIFASDGKIGHVEDFIFEDENWTLRFIVVKTGIWRPERRILLSLQWMNRVEWGDSSLHFNIPMEVMEKSPEFDHTQKITRDYTDKLHGHYKGSGR
ncbi:MAG: PRC-barrel domain-containing protein [Victivallales bacterium]